MSYFIVAQITIHDRETYKRYQAAFAKMFTAYDGKVLAADDKPRVMEGEWPGTRTAIIQFSSREEAERWYYSDTYQEIMKQYRLPASKSNVALMKGF